MDFSKNAEVVARDLLGCILVREINGRILKAKIVETEAYFDEKDPASRATQNGDIRKTMFMESGTILVYGVHSNWLLNIVTGKKEEPQAVLIRALEPINFEGNPSGPGRLTKVLGINKEFHKEQLSEELYVEGRKEEPIIERSHRIGVSKDLEEKHRYYINGNKNVSKFS